MNADFGLDGLIGTKVGMSHVFSDDGSSIPVTLIQVTKTAVVQRKTVAKDGYSAVQIGSVPVKPSRLSRGEQGHLSKAEAGAFRHLAEFRVDDSADFQMGQTIAMSDVFAVGQYVDISGTSLGRGFSGVFRRYGMKGQPSTRGTHEVRRHVGSVGCRKTPGRIFKNKRMPGRYGGKAITVQNLKVLNVLAEEGVLVVKGAVPGAVGNTVKVTKAIKK